MSQQVRSLKERIQDDMKSALKSGDKRRLGVIRLILAAIQKREVDERKDLGEAQVLIVLDKMVKQRRESADLYQRAGREDLREQESFELSVLQEYLPEALSEQELQALINSAIEQVGASSMGDMGKVMGILKGQVQGRADMASVSTQVKARLT